MGRGKVYRRVDAVVLWDAESQTDMAEMDGETSFTAWEGVRMVGAGFAWCREFGAPIEKGEGCGKLCEKYSPRNGKSGMCMEWRHCYEDGQEVRFEKGEDGKWRVMKVEEDK